MSDDLNLQEYLDRAKGQFSEKHEYIRNLAEANNALLGNPSLIGEITASGQATFATAFVYGTTSCDLTFNDGTKVRFYGTQWGLGLGGGTSWGGGVFAVPPSELLGSCSFETHSVAGAGGFVSITWWRGSQLLGTFTGAALAVSASITGGSGDWTKA